MNLIKRYAAALAMFGAATAIPYCGWAQKTGFKVLNDYKINSPGGWDYILADGANKRVYVSHGSQVNVISTTGDSLGVIPKTTGYTVLRWYIRLIKVLRATAGSTP